MKKPILTAVSLIAIAIIVVLLSSSKPSFQSDAGDVQKKGPDAQVASETQEGQYRKVKLYYSDPTKDECRQSYEAIYEGQDEDVRKGLVEVERDIPESTDIIKTTMLLFMEGKLTESESAQGIISDYPLQGVSLSDVSLDGDILKLTFDDPQGSTRGVSCTVVRRRLQFEEIARQFPEVKSISFLPEGKVFVADDF